jgi:hypothetical protein
VLSLICLVIAGILFALAGFNEPIFHQPELDEIAFAGMFIVLSKLLGGWGPPSPWVRNP